MKEINVRRLNRILSYLFNEIRLLTDEDRDLPIRWNLAHMYSSSQLAKLIAIKRNLDPELSAIIAAVHDIAVVKTKRKEDHAIKSEKYINEIIDHYNHSLRYNLPEITLEERNIIIQAAIHHSAKEVESSNPYVELMKDVDALDRFLHGIKTEDEYRTRCINALLDLNLN